ncbi:MAG: polysaccharide pyruvyl transferase family protein [Candidatus Krumholzibacteriia bacterium]
MAFLLVGDNRSNTNWGGRSASLALLALARERLGAGESVTGAELLLGPAGYGVRSRLLPPSQLPRARALAAGRVANPLLRGLWSLDRALGGGDFLTDDPEESVRNLLARRSQDPGLHRLHEQVSRADVVVVNGEGDVVFSRPVRRQVRFFAMVVHLARRLGKPVAFVNTMLADCARTGRDRRAFAATRAALELCDLVTVRDAQSLRIATGEMGLNDCRLIPDTLFTWYGVQQDARRQLPRNGDFVIPHPELDRYLGRLDLDGGYVCVGGNSLVTQPGQAAPIAAAYRRICAGLKALGLPVVVVISDGRDSFLEEIAGELDLATIPLQTPIYLAAAIVGRARLLVSGRYHPTIMAALGGTPCLYLATGSHKLHSLAAGLEDGDQEIFPPAPDPDDVGRLCDLARDRLAAGQTLRDRIAATAARRADEAAELGPLLGTLAATSTVTVESRHA